MYLNSRRPLLSIGKTAFALPVLYPDIIFSKFSVQIYGILKNYIVYQIQIKTAASEYARMLLPEWNAWNAGMLWKAGKPESCGMQECGSCAGVRSSLSHQLQVGQQHTGLEYTTIHFIIIQIYINII